MPWTSATPVTAPHCAKPNWRSSIAVLCEPRRGGPWGSGNNHEDYVGIRGLEEHGKKKWQRHAADVVKRLIAALEPDEVVLGGGNVKKLDALQAGTQAGDNDNAFRGGFRLWEKAVN